MRFDMETLPISMMTGDDRRLRWGNNGSWRQFGVRSQRRRWSELREGLRSGFEQKFFVMRETMGRRVRVGERAHPDEGIE
ncbi:hypothetical protein JQ631_19810 [Bradyrhizobium manausense]|uniref:hypothetical protein n=1 Tax=Bradyrhizobium manausense TaxID=989370 RepID=UPI001BA6477F|nr:hypothetical protein [Bradyrhizobium manausense]MBR0791328.1 hypothetical protein [Bradyrhizobium manausense]